MQVTDFFISNEEQVRELNVTFLNCSDPGSSLGSLQHCCSNAGITINPIMGTGEAIL